MKNIEKVISNNVTNNNYIKAIFRSDHVWLNWLNATGVFDTMDYYTQLIQLRR